MHLRTIPKIPKRANVSDNQAQNLDQITAVSNESEQVVRRAASYPFLESLVCDGRSRGAIGRSVVNRNANTVQAGTDVADITTSTSLAKLSVESPGNLVCLCF